MNIRLMTANDWLSWKALRLEGLANVPEAFYSSYEEECTWSDQAFRKILETNSIFGAFDENELMGCMAMGIMSGIKPQHQGVVWGVYVKPQYRGLKVGDALLLAVIAHAKTTVKQLQLSAHTENKSALRLYQRHGFELYGTEPRAIKLNDRYYDECLLMLVFSKTSSEMLINESLVHKLISFQFPQWADFPITPVAESGWDNRTFHLGDKMLVRMPSGEKYSLQVDKEQKWLPRLAPHLPLPIPAAIAIGEPGEGYPWHWSVNRWLEGETASAERIGDLVQFAKDLGAFLVALQAIDTTGGPIAGPHSFYRGGDLSNYDSETRQSIKILKDKLDVNTITKIWEDALSTTWEQPPVWVHGDVALGNLLVNNGRLCAVIDFGQLVIGDPACDLAITWTFFKGKSREAFKRVLSLDEGTWARARGWTLWKALIIASGLVGGNSVEAKASWRIIEDVIAES